MQKAIKRMAPIETITVLAAAAAASEIIRLSACLSCYLLILRNATSIENGFEMHTFINEKWCIGFVRFSVLKKISK